MRQHRRTNRNYSLQLPVEPLFVRPLAGDLCTAVLHLVTDLVHPALGLVRAASDAQRPLPRPRVSPEGSPHLVRDALDLGLLGASEACSSLLVGNIPWSKKNIFLLLSHKNISCLPAPHVSIAEFPTENGCSSLTAVPSGRVSLEMEPWGMSGQSGVQTPSNIGGCENGFKLLLTTDVYRSSSERFEQHKMLYKEKQKHSSSSSNNNNSNSNNNNSSSSNNNNNNINNNNNNNNSTSRSRSSSNKNKNRIKRKQEECFLIFLLPPPLSHLPFCTCRDSFASP